MIGLAEVQASLALFAEAIQGAPVTLDSVDTSASCWPWGPREPHGHITLPVEARSHREYRTLLLHQLLAAPAIEQEDRSQALVFVVVFEMIEDLRVRAETARRFPGAVADLADLLQGLHQQKAAGDTLLDELRRYCLGAGRVEVHSRPSAADPVALDELLDLADEVTETSATPLDSRRIAHRICWLIAGDAGATTLAALGDEIVPDDEVGDPLASDGTTGVSLESGTPTEFVESDGLAGGQLLSESEDDLATVRAPEDAEQPGLGLDLPVEHRGRAAGQNRSFVYDEWDYRAQTHRRAWCRVTEEHLVGDDHAFIDDVRHRHHALRSQIRHRLLKMPAKELVRMYRRYDGDELDLDAALEALADRRSGAPVDDRLQIRRDRAARDVATAFLVDLSASTSSPAAPPEPEPPSGEPDPFDDPMSYGPIWGAPPELAPVRRVIDVAKDAVALMGDALHALGDRHAIYGFSGTGRDGVEFKIGKDFDDRVTAAGWAAVAAMRPLRYTRMGPAVRHAASKLAKESARTKLLIVLSDGYPQDTDYGSDRHDREYGLHDTARALTDAAAAGIETFCVTIDPAGHDYLRQMLPPDRYLVIDDVESLPEELARLYFLTLRR